MALKGHQIAALHSSILRELELRRQERDVPLYQRSVFRYCLLSNLEASAGTRCDSPA